MTEESWIDIEGYPIAFLFSDGKVIGGLLSEGGAAYWADYEHALALLKIDEQDFNYALKLYGRQNNDFGPFLGVGPGGVRYVRSDLMKQVESLQGKPLSLCYTSHYVTRHLT